MNSFKMAFINFNLFSVFIKILRIMPILLYLYISLKVAYNGNEEINISFNKIIHQSVENENALNICFKAQVGKRIPIPVSFHIKIKQGHKILLLLKIIKHTANFECVYTVKLVQSDFHTRAVIGDQICTVHVFQTYEQHNLQQL